MRVKKERERLKTQTQHEKEGREGKRVSMAVKLERACVSPCSDHHPHGFDPVGETGHLQPESAMPRLATLRKRARVASTGVTTTTTTTTTEAAPAVVVARGEQTNCQQNLNGGGVGSSSNQRQKLAEIPETPMKDGSGGGAKNAGVAVQKRDDDVFALDTTTPTKARAGGASTATPGTAAAVTMRMPKQFGKTAFDDDEEEEGPTNTRERRGSTRGGGGGSGSGGGAAQTMAMIKTPEHKSAPRKLPRKCSLTSDNWSSGDILINESSYATRLKRKLAASMPSVGVVTRRVSERAVEGDGTAPEIEEAVTPKFVHTEGTALREPPNIKLQHREAKRRSLLAAQANGGPGRRPACVRSLFDTRSPVSHHRRNLTPTFEEMKDFARRAGVSTAK